MANQSPLNRSQLNTHKDQPVDTSTLDIHHTLGRSANQAMPGNVLGSVTLTGSRSTATASVLQQVIQALVLLGARDNTSA